jgi:hypothetical protein
MKPKLAIPDEPTQRSLRHQFTNEELLEVARQLAEASGRRNTLEAEKSAITKQYASSIADVERAIDDKAAKVSQGYEFRMIDCTIKFDFPHPGHKTVVRNDTGEHIDTTAMTAEEKQMKLDQIEAASKAAPEPKRIAGADTSKLFKPTKPAVSDDL